MSEKSEKIRITASSKDVFKLIEFSDFLPNMRIWRKSDILQDQISGAYYRDYQIIYDDPNDYKTYSDSLLPQIGEWVLIKEDMGSPYFEKKGNIVQVVDRTNVEQTNMLKVRRAYSINYESDQRFSSDKWDFICNDHEKIFDIPLSAIISCSSEKLANLWIPKVNDFVYLNKYAEKYKVEYYNTRHFKEIVDPNAIGAYGQILEVQLSEYKAKIMWWRDRKTTHSYDNCDHCASWFYFSHLIPHKIKPKSPR